MRVYRIAVPVEGGGAAGGDHVTELVEGGGAVGVYHSAQPMETGGALGVYRSAHPIERGGALGVYCSAQPIEGGGAVRSFTGAIIGAGRARRVEKPSLQLYLLPMALSYLVDPRADLPQLLQDVLVVGLEESHFLADPRNSRL